jgi:hypothetical protein
MWNEDANAYEAVKQPIIAWMVAVEETKRFDQWPTYDCDPEPVTLESQPLTKYILMPDGRVVEPESRSWDNLASWLEGAVKRDEYKRLQVLTKEE